MNVLSTTLVDMFATFSVLLAQFMDRGFGGGGLAFWVIAVIVAVGLLSILFVFLKARGWNPPPEFITYGWIVIAVVVAVIAVKIIIHVANI